MFYVINKSKIYSYLIALCTVVILFVAATTINDMASPSGNVVQTGANITNEGVKNTAIKHTISENRVENSMIQNQINGMENKNNIK